MARSDQNLVFMAPDSSHRIIRGGLWPDSSAFIFDRVSFILAGNEDNQNVSNEFEIRPDPIMDGRVSCH